MKLTPGKRKRPEAPVAGAPPAAKKAPASSALNAAYGEEFVVDLKRRRDQLVVRAFRCSHDSD